MMALAYGLISPAIVLLVAAIFWVAEDEQERTK